MRNNKSSQEIPSQEWLYENISDSKYDDLFAAILEETEPVTDKESIERGRKALGEFVAPDKQGKSRSSCVRKLFNWTVAASLVLVSAMFANHLNRPEPQWMEVYASVGEVVNVNLPDGTQVCLNSDTKLIYPSEFARKSRNIYVDGEIFADVSKDPERPFVISSQDVDVKVYGTQLRVKSYVGEDETEVALISGVVDVVFGADDPGAVTHKMSPGQMMRYNRNSRTIENYTADTGISFWNHHKCIKFVNETLDNIAADLERRFGVEIVVEGKTLANTRYYASFINGEDIESILNTLNSNKSMRIRKLNDAYIITNAQ